MPARRPLGLDQERRLNGSIFESTAELTTALEVDVFIFPSRLDIRSLLRMMISVGGGCTLLPRSTAKLFPTHQTSIRY